LINEAKIKGIAISFNALMNIVPKGLIQSEIKAGPKERREKITPNRIPANMPIKIFQCRATFFMGLFSNRSIEQGEIS